MIAVWLVGVSLLLLVWDYRVRKHRSDTFARSRISGPRSLPLFGCGLDAINLGADNLIQFIGACFERYGKTFRFWVLAEAQVYTMDVRHFEAVLGSTTLLRKGDLYDYLRSWLNDGLLLSTGRKWHRRRKIFTPAFHFNVLEHYVSVFDEQSAIMARQLRPRADGRTAIDMFGPVSLAALDVITEAAMGVKVNAQLDPDFPYVHALKSVVSIQPSRMLKLSQRYDCLFRLCSPRIYRQLTSDIQAMHDFTIEVIEKRRAELHRSLSDSTYRPLCVGDAAIGSRSQMALLDILLQARIDGQPLTNEDIREEVDTFMFEGDDTTTSGVSHALYCIARHPRVQQKLVAEIVRVVGRDPDTPITMQQLLELRYLECVLKETLRLHPPVPAIGRKTDRDLDLGDGCVVPANTSVYLVLYYAHRDPDSFPDPHTFHPERFAEGDEDGDGGDEGGDKGGDEGGDIDDGIRTPRRRNAFAYVPFSGGPKNCIGQKFAMLELKAMVSKMLRHYELLPLGGDIEVSFNFILRSSRGAHVGLKPRVYSD